MPRPVTTTKVQDVRKLCYQAFHPALAAATASGGGPLPTGRTGYQDVNVA